MSGEPKSQTTAEEIERLRAELGNAFKMIWTLVREAGGEATISTCTLHAMSKTSRLKIVPSADGTKQHMSATL